MEKQRILRLAMEELQRRKAEIELEIVSLRAELDGRGTASAQAESLAPSAGGRRRRVRTAAQRKAQAAKMREIWARKRKEAAKKRSAGGAKVRTKTEAQKKAQSQKMKEAWKRRKAAAASLEQK